MSITLTHFTAGKFVRRIRMQGLTEGKTPISIKGQLAFLYDQQWLTTSQDWFQRWNRFNERSLIKYDRTEARLTIRIPRSHQNNVVTWGFLRQKLNILALLNFEDCGGWEDWRVYLGHVEPSWIIGVDAKRDPFSVAPARVSTSKEFSWGKYAKAP